VEPESEAPRDPGFTSVDIGEMLASGVPRRTEEAEMGAARIALQDPSRFHDPSNLTWERYIALQARERERYQAERATIPPDVLAYKAVSPRYVERAVEQFANNYFPELSATRYVATAAANAPFEELKKCCLFQLADEQRHLEMDREVFERAGIPEADWLPAWEQPGTTCRFFRHVLELEDSVEILVKANFVAEGAAGPATFAVLADGAEARGDLLSAVNHRARVRDETRHISYARALVRALIEENPANLDVIQRWQDESLQLFVEVAKGGQRREWWRGFLDSYYKIALPLGLRPTTLPV
jgi:phenol hydroxylase P3 protein